MTMTTPGINEDSKEEEPEKEKERDDKVEEFSDLGKSSYSSSDMNFF